MPKKSFNKLSQKTCLCHQQKRPTPIYKSCCYAWHAKLFIVSNACYMNDAYRPTVKRK